MHQTVTDRFARFVGAELKASYYQQACRNLREAQTTKQGGLFA